MTRLIVWQCHSLKFGRPALHLDTDPETPAIQATCGERLKNVRENSAGCCQFSAPLKSQLLSSVPLCGFPCQNLTSQA